MTRDNIVFGYISSLYVTLITFLLEKIYIKVILRHILFIFELVNLYVFQISYCLLYFARISYINHIFVEENRYESVLNSRGKKSLSRDRAWEYNHERTRSIAKTIDTNQYMPY